MGYRHKSDDKYIVGLFSHFDLRNTRYNAWNQQMTIGGELFSDYMELRVNGYFPLSKPKELSKKVVGATPRIEGHQVWMDKKYKTVKEVTMHGWDVEVGGCFPQFDRVDIFGGYYNFLGNGVKTIHGLRARTNIKLNDYFSIE